LFPMPAVLVGTYGEDGIPNAMTAAWTSACCQSPPCLGVAVRKSRLTFDNIVARSAFTINVPSVGLVKEVDYLGIISGKKRPDKLERIGVAVVRAREVDAPLLTDCPVCVECRLVQSLEIGSHTWFAGEVVQVHADEEIVGEDGKIDVAKLDPLAYCTSAGEYWSMGLPVGDAYEVGKQLR
jgi:flavin reductase (DIM6/NTAB) family NADH-FMN oxidoreductase RutF